MKWGIYMTAQEVRKQSFQQTKLGYNTDEVDLFLDQIADQLDKFEKEREETERKMEVLVQSIRRYKDDEEAIKDAMVDARRQKQAIIAEAQQSAEKIIADANIRADEIVGTTSDRLSRESKALEEMQDEVKKFKSKILAMYKEHLSIITALPGDDSDEEEEYIAEETYTDEDMGQTKVLDTTQLKNAE
ncbi:MAG: DivIVA domain-containing protein [Oscillospiraceae bacterium]|nr:DivIVA domain-containing protein [Oscillospiraceae bacterium]MBQ8979507.1 DivIVA domain-containing protein [Oscillospiraceae bacterium]